MRSRRGQEEAGQQADNAKVLLTPDHSLSIKGLAREACKGSSCQVPPSNPKPTHPAGLA